ncbi:hypothetical protein F2Q69_00048828 [Brassica cretica]|uniref:Uncharacterized protein n=1 Tax=Brassica cretica TaxID=69181 RepID=A0A8S9PY10_BRACR|nr:hypothetical protein F2Q69_00048828 [Brassica cretica]
MANAYANATVLEKIENLAATFRHRKCNETSSRFLFLIIKGNNKSYQTPANFGSHTVAATRKRRRSAKDTLPGPSRPRFVPEGDCSLFASQGDLISLAGRMRYAGCRLPSLASSAEKEAYDKVAVASSKVMEAFNEYVVMMEDHVVASRNDKEIESIGSEIKRLSGELEAAKIHQENEALTTKVVAQKAKVAALEVERDRDILRASHIARHDINQRHREILGSLKDKWTSKKKEVSAEIQLQEVTANIDLLNELKDRGLTVDAELARLKDVERDCEDLVTSDAVPDWSISELDLPQISEDSVDQIGGSSVPDVFGIPFARVVEIRRRRDLYKALLCFRIYHSASFNFVLLAKGIWHREDQTLATPIGCELELVALMRNALIRRCERSAHRSFREETRLPRASAQEVKDLEGEKSAARVKLSLKRMVQTIVSLFWVKWLLLNCFIGRTPASGSPVPKIPTRRNPSPRMPPSSGKWKTSDKENLPYFRIWKSLTYSNRLRSALGRPYKGNLNPKTRDRHFET